MIAGQTKENEKVGAVLVVGAGIAGIQASLDLAESGQKVYLLENGPAIGGNMPRLDKTFPTNDCSMCILSPKIVECGRHLNVEAVTWSELENISGSEGHFRVEIRKRARYIDMSKCTGCGECAEACPVTVPNEFDADLTTRKAIFRSYPQAYPNAFVIDKSFFPACRHACPAGVNVHGFVALLAEGKFDDALELYRTRNPFPASCGRICDHPCQLACNRGRVDEALAIRDLHRFLADREIRAAAEGRPSALTEEIRKRREAAFSHRGAGKRVAVVGSGPAGLACAWDLANMGYKPVVFEKLGVAGGMLRVGVPQYRLPGEVLEYEIEAIRQAGAEIKLNTPLGSNLTLDDVFSQGFEAVFIAAGLHKSRQLRIEGEDLDGVLYGTDFLREAKYPEPPDMRGKVVVVIGGGNVAIDVARTVARLEAEEVHVACLEASREMFASDEEVQGAREEGVTIHNRLSPKRFVGSDGHLSGIEFLECISVFDPEGRFDPKVKEGTENIMSTDLVIVAIGQSTDWDLMKVGDSALKTERGLFTVNEAMATNIQGIFAGGDAVSGPDVAVNAVLAGHRAAVSIDRFLNCEDLVKDRDDLADMVSVDQLAPVPDGPHAYGKRPDMRLLPVDERTRGFDEVEQGYTEEQAVEEAKRCLHCTVCSECLQCVQVCKAEAICHDQTDEIVEIDVGAVVVVPGFSEYSCRLQYDYGYSRYPDVVSSMEFERILSATGPFAGHVQRLSDGKEPKKIAFLQCVGSRDVSCRNRYCSSVCCMYAIKEAVIAKEHMGGRLDVTVFFMDMRAFGKDFDKYYERAKSQYGVRFVRARVGDVYQAANDEHLIVKYSPADGCVAEDSFDMVVLSVGLEPPSNSRELAKKLGLRLEPNGFIHTAPGNPLNTSRPGIVVGGAGSGPKDIPETVTQASGAAGKVSQLLADMRHTQTKERTFPPERNVTGQEPRIGVFICQCGINIGGTVDVPSATDYAKTLLNVVHAENNLYTCSQDTQDHIREEILKNNLNRVIVASCTPRTHEPLFRETVRAAGLNPYLFEMANIRDQCSWVHMQEPEEATEKAKDLISMAVAKARRLEPLYSVSVPVTAGAVVVGGGIAGMTAALSLAEQGYSVDLVEKHKELGGSLTHLRYLLNGDDPAKRLNDTVTRVQSHPAIRVWTEAVVEDVKGFVGNFQSTVLQNGARTDIEHGAIIVAVGADESKPREYLYGKNDSVLTQRELEERLAVAGSEFQVPASVVMIQCVGSREEGHMYCSRICCASAVKNALKIKELSPETEVTVLYRDIRTYGFNEEQYQAARDKGVIFVRYEPEAKPVVEDEDGLKVSVTEPLLGKKLVLHPNLLVLSARIDPNSDNERLGQILKVPLNEDRFFLEAHMKLRPVDFAVEGVYLAGMAHSPKSVDETIAQAEAAASRAATVISKKEYVPEAIVSSVDEDVCAACGVCVSICSYDAPEIVEVRGKKFSRINRILCKGCGACAMACPSGAAQQLGFRPKQVVDMVSAALED